MQPRVESVVLCSSDSSLGTWCSEGRRRRRHRCRGSARGAAARLGITSPPQRKCWVGNIVIGRAGELAVSAGECEWNWGSGPTPSRAFESCFSHRVGALHPRTDVWNSGVQPLVGMIPEKSMTWRRAAKVCAKCAIGVYSCLRPTRHRSPPTHT